MLMDECIVVAVNPQMDKLLFAQSAVFVTYITSPSQANLYSFFSSSLVCGIKIALLIVYYNYYYLSYF